MITAKIAEAIGLSIALFGLVLSIVAIGTTFFAYKILKEKKPELIEMSLLTVSWAIFIFLNVESSSSPDYKTAFLVYSTPHLISIILGTIIILIFFIMVSKFFGKFDKKLLIIAPIFAILSILQRVIFPFFGNPYLSLILRITIIIPPLLGFLMIIESVIEEKEK